MLYAGFNMIRQVWTHHDDRMFVNLPMFLSRSMHSASQNSRRAIKYEVYIKILNDKVKIAKLNKVNKRR